MVHPSKNEETLDPAFHEYAVVNGTDLVVCHPLTVFKAFNAEQSYRGDDEAWMSFVDDFVSRPGDSVCSLHECLQSTGEIVSQVVSNAYESSAFSTMESVALQSLPEETVLINPSVGTISRSLMLGKSFDYQFVLDDVYDTDVSDVVKGLIETEKYLGKETNKESSIYYLGFSYSKYYNKVKGRRCGFHVDFKYTKFCTLNLLGELEDDFVMYYRGYEKVFMKNTLSKYSYLAYTQVPKSCRTSLVESMRWVTDLDYHPFGHYPEYVWKMKITKIFQYPELFYLDDIPSRMMLYGIDCYCLKMNDEYYPVDIVSNAVFSCRQEMLFELIKTNRHFKFMKNSRYKRYVQYVGQEVGDKGCFAADCDFRIIQFGGLKVRSGELFRMEHSCMTFLDLKGDFEVWIVASSNLKFVQNYSKVFELNQTGNSLVYVRKCGNYYRTVGLHNCVFKLGEGLRNFQVVNINEVKPTQVWYEEIGSKDGSGSLVEYNGIVGRDAIVDILSVREQIDYSVFGVRLGNLGKR